MSHWDFANILLTGPCNLRCPFCIGGSKRSRARPSTLDRFPLPGLEAFGRALAQGRTHEVSLTGIDTEPLLYRHQGPLIDWLRSAVPGVRISLHTNGTRVLADPALFNRYDRATISLPSFDSATCRAMTGSPRVLDLGAIVAVARIPIKVSTLVTTENVAEIPALVERCRSLGLGRLVLRKLAQRASPPLPVEGWRQVASFGGNPVYDAGGIEVTVWDFAATSLSCLSLWPDGRLTTDYRLEPPRRAPSSPGPREARARHAA